MGKWHSRLYKTDRARDFDHERDRRVRARQVYETIDRQPFQWIVVIVAGIGFFLDGYTLFASNIALPMIDYVYWGPQGSGDKLAWINIATLAGTLMGQLLFGVLADQNGRKKMYGVELVVLIVSTLGVVMASAGTHTSMSIFGWLLFWRFMTGVGVGADYPLSAIITSEFAPTAKRARMLAVIFFMQPLGQTAGNLLSMVVISITRRTLGEGDLVRAVDIMWRWIIGIGVFPGVLAIIFRFIIPETPRFLLEIQDDPAKAEFDANNLFGDTGDDEDLVSPTGSHELEAGMWKLDTRFSTHVARPKAASFSSIPGSNQPIYCDDITALDVIDDRQCHSATSYYTNLTAADWTLAVPRPPTLNSKWALTRADIYQYFFKEGNWRTLVGTSCAWFLLDFGFYGIGLSSAQFLARTWGDLNIHGPSAPWRITDDPNVSVYEQFIRTSLHALAILNLGSVVGSILLILLINRLNRVALQRYGFLFLAAIFVAMGVTFLSTDHRSGPLAITLYVVAQLAFNFGPNATTYILPAELFPTRYRATCYGISAAMGKLGSIVMQLVGTFATNHGRSHVSSSPQAHAEQHANVYAKLLMGFAGAMVLGFVVSLWIPDVQEKVVDRRRASVDVREHDTQVGVIGNLRRRIRGATSAVTGVTTKGTKSRTLEELSAGRMGTKSTSAHRPERDSW